MSNAELCKEVIKIGADCVATSYASLILADEGMEISVSHEGERGLTSIER